MKKILPSHLTLLGIVAIVLAWSAWQPYDRLTWWLEVLPALAALAVLFATYRRFEFTTLTYTLIALHMCVLFVGNHYDRLGHIVQGFVPAIVTREVFVRLQILRKTGWQPFLVVCVCLAISAFYELIEWWTALASGDAAISFLGTQGDPWDTQEDMFCALLSAIAAIALLSRVQDRAINRLVTHTSS